MYYITYKNFIENWKVNQTCIIKYISAWLSILNRIKIYHCIFKWEKLHDKKQI